MGDIDAVLLLPDDDPWAVRIPRDVNGSVLNGFLRVLQTQAVDVIELSDQIDLWVDASWRDGPSFNMTATAVVQAFTGDVEPAAAVHGAVLFTGAPDGDGETQSLTDSARTTLNRILTVIAQVRRASPEDGNA